MTVIDQGKKLVKELSDTGSVKVGEFIIRKKYDGCFLLFAENGAIKGGFHSPGLAVGEAFKRSL